MGGERKLLKIAQSASLDERKDNAQKCIATLKLSIPTLLDKEDNRVNNAYAAWPDRLYVIGKDGAVAYKGGPGPGGFRVEEVVDWLKKNAR